MAFRDLTTTFLDMRNTFRRVDPHMSHGNTIEMADVRANLDRRQLLGSDGSRLSDSLGVDDAGAGVALTLTPVWMDSTEEIQYELGVIKKKMSELDILHKKHLRPGFDDRVEEEQTIEILTQEITSIFRQCEAQVMRIGEQDKAAISHKEFEIRKNIQISLATQLRDMSTEFRVGQREYLESLRRLTDYDSGLGINSDLEIGGAGVNAPQTEAEYYDRGFNEAQSQTLASGEQVVSERSREIEQIHKSITDLAEVFQELAVLVIDQGTILDRIDYNIEQVSQHTSEALEEVRKASKLQKKYRTKICILLLLALIVLMTVLLITKGTGGSSGPTNGSGTTQLNMQLKFPSAAS